MKPKARLIIFGVIVCVLLFSPINHRAHTVFLNRLLDAGHFPFFFLVTLVINYYLSSRKAIIFSLLVVVLSEAIQPLFNRSTTWVDLENGLLGVLLAGLFIFVWQLRPTKFALSLVFCLTGSVFFYTLIPSVRAWQTIVWQKEQFPLLAEFEDSRENNLWYIIRGKRCEYRIGQGKLSVKTTPRMYSGMTFDAGYSDWSPYSNLIFSVYNPGEQFYLIIRIDDDGDIEKYDSRFSGRFLISTGSNQIRIRVNEIKTNPIKRNLNISNITRVFFFVSPLDPSRHFELDNLRLE